MDEVTSPYILFRFQGLVTSSTTLIVLFDRREFQLQRVVYCCGYVFQFFDAPTAHQCHRLFLLMRMDHQLVVSLVARFEPSCSDTNPLDIIALKS